MEAEVPVNHSNTTRPGPPAADVDVTTPTPTLPQETSTSEPAQNSAPVPQSPIETLSGAQRLSPFAIETHSFLGRHEQIEATDTNYVLCYIDGFPYLVKGADRARSVRRSRRHLANSNSAQPASNAAPVSAAHTSGNDAIVQQRHVDLPATAAIPVRTAEGRRALILSPEGVRAMAAQGVNVDTGAAGRPALGVNYVSLRRYISAGVPHGWLVLKLVFLVTMLGSNASWTRFMILNVIAFGIFLWQSGILGRTLARQPVGAAQNGGPMRPPVDARQSPGANADQPLNAPHTSRATAQAAAAPTMFQSFTNAFIASIVPRNANQIQPLVNAPEEVRGHVLGDGNAAGPDADHSAEAASNQRAREQREQQQAAVDQQMRRDW